MSGISYLPPTENLPIFDDFVFQINNDPLTYNTASGQFLKYPTAQGNESFVNTSTGENLTISSVGLNSSNSISLTANDNITLNSNGLGNINLDVPNIDSYTYSMPICFTRERSDTFSYTSGGQTVEIVYTTDFNIPYQFVAENPLFGYTSKKWKIDFSLNCFNCSNLGDKGIALFIVFQDQASTYYLPNNYNPDTPYAKWQNGSTYSSPAYGGFQNFNWTDYIDLSGLSGTGSGNVPLIMTLAFAGDSGFSCNFHMTCTLTRTNLI